VDIKI